MEGGVTAVLVRVYTSTSSMEKVSADTRTSRPLLYENLHLIHVGCSHARGRPIFGGHDVAHRNLLGPTHLPDSFVVQAASNCILVLLLFAASEV